MNNDILKECKNKGCNNPVLNGKYCENCSQIKKEKRDNVIKGAGGILLGVGAFVLSALLKKPRE
jgi:hypothetical protein